MSELCEAQPTPAVVEVPADAALAESCPWFKRKKVVIGFQVLSMLLGASALGGCILYFRGGQKQLDWVLAVLIAVVSLLAGCWSTLRRFRDYTLPTRKLQQMIPRVRLSEIPIEELSSIKGGIEPIIPLVQELLRDLRQERMRIARLEEETRQRVMSRTDALERKIGSLRHQATRDSLTGLCNRRHLDEALPQAIELSLATYTDLTVMMIDVDYFKMLNDTLGHAAGDDLLRQIAQLIRSTVRENDLAFRCGGDEFVIVLPQTNEDVAGQMATRLRSLVDSLGKTLKVTRPPRLSIGLGSLAKTGARTAHDLLVAADKALYDVKSTRPVPSRVA